MMSINLYSKLDSGLLSRKRRNKRETSFLENIVSKVDVLTNLHFANIVMPKKCNMSLQFFFRSHEKILLACSKISDELLFFYS